MNLSEFKSKLIDKKGYIIAALTDKYVIDRWPMINPSCSEDLIGNEEKVLEIRFFNKDEECKLYRSDISKRFLYRELNDKNEQCRDHYDEIQFLDIDEVKSEKVQASKGFASIGFNVMSTGSGKYFCPINNIHNARIRVRYYIGEYKDSGQTRVEDWRLVEFMEG